MSAKTTTIMAITLNILMVLLGLSTLIYSYFEIRVWGSLYFDRDTYCIEKFRKATKATDLVSCLHNMTKCVFGVTLIVVGFNRLIPITNTGTANTALIVSYVTLVLDMVVVELLIHFSRLSELRSSIERQWHIEKHINQDHDHEVNLYRGIVRVTQRYPRHIFTMGVCMIILQIFII